jgi:heptosyltransferase-1
MSVVLLGGPADKAAASRIVDNCKGKVVDLAGATTLTQAVAVIGDASLVIGVDTGLTHVGIAQAAPTLALFGSTIPYRDTGVPHTEVLYHQLPCSPCKRKPTCDGRFDCMREIAVDDVIQAVGRVWSAVE